MIDTFKALEQTRSRNEKEAILKGLEGDSESLFKYIAYLTYDPSIDFYIKEFNTNCEHIPSISLLEALTDLKNIIATRSFTGNQAKKWVEMTYSMLDEDMAEIFKRVVKRDLRCGISATTINKIWPDTIYVHPYMRCSGFSEKSLKNISFPCYSQTKMDGLYLDIMVFDDKVEYRTRNGSFLLLNDDDFDKSLIKHFPNQVLMGEALVLDDISKQPLDRQTSNGYLNSNDIEPERVKFYVWDMIPLEDFLEGKSKVSYEDRLNNLDNNLGFLDSQRITIVETAECHTQEDIINDFRESRMNGNEGTIIKDKTLDWKSGTSKKQIKVKVIFDCDLKIVDYKMGEGKYKDKIGSLVGESSCGQLQVSVGTGLKDSERESFLDKVDEWIENGAVMAIKANDVVTNQNDPDKYALFLPRFIEVRTDKNNSDDLNRIQNQVKSFTDALKLIA